MQAQSEDKGRSGVDVTFDREAFAPTDWFGKETKAFDLPEPCWNVAIVRVRCERLAVEHINNLGIEAFVPIQEEMHQWRDRRKKVERVITPALVFFNPASKHNNSHAPLRYSPSAQELRRRQFEVCRTPYVYRLMSVPGSTKPANVPCEQMEMFKYMLGMADGPVDMETDFREGDYVRVMRGRLRGIEGFIEQLPRGQQSVRALPGGKPASALRLGIRIYPIGYAVTGISAADVELVKRGEKSL